MNNGVTRRDFLRYAALAGAGIVIVMDRASPIRVPSATAPIPATSQYAASVSVSPSASLATADGPLITYVPGSNVKPEQHLREEDKELHSLDVESLRLRSHEVTPADRVSAHNKLKSAY